MITGIHNVHYFVENMDRAVAFYIAAFEAELIHSDETWSTLKIHGLTVGLHGNDDKPIPRTTLEERGVNVGGTLTLKSNNIPVDKARLEKLGATIIKEFEADWGKVLVFEDLDGHVLNLVHPSY